MEPRLSVQLYTVREALAKDLPGTLERVASLGYRNVELFDFVEQAARYRELLGAFGLGAPSGHCGLVGPGRDPRRAFEAALEVGVKTVVDPSIDRRRWTTREDVVAVAADLNRVAEVASGYGLAVGYHNHHYEVANRIDGATALEVLSGHLSEEVVLEVDTYWAEVGGAQAAGLLKRLGPRVQLLHIKDGPVTMVDKEQVAVGSGSLDVPAILAAAPEALRVVELDDFEGDVFVALSDSFAYLTAQGVAP